MVVSQTSVVNQSVTAWEIPSRNVCTFKHFIFSGSYTTIFYSCHTSCIIFPTDTGDYLAEDGYQGTV